MIAATRVELRSMFGSLVQCLVIGIAILMPVIALGFEEVQNTLLGHDFPVRWTYDDLITTVLGAGGLAVLVTATWIGTSSHRHRVFGSYAVTGHPRDLLFLGRLGAAWSVALLVGVGISVTGLLMHWLTDRSNVLQTEVGQDVATGQYLQDVASTLLVLVLGAAFLVGLGSFLRSALATVGVVIVLAILDNMARDSARQRWIADAELVPVDQLYSVSRTFEDPWWSVTAAANRAIDNVAAPGGLDAALGAGGVALVAGWALLACSAGLFRLVRRDV